MLTTELAATEAVAQTTQRDSVVWMTLRIPKLPNMKTPVLAFTTNGRDALECGDADAGADIGQEVALDWQTVCWGGYEATSPTGHWLVVSGPLCDAG